MFGLLDDNEPPPRFSFSALLALLAGAAMCAWEAVVLWGVVTTGPDYLLLVILVAPIMLVPPATIACLVCCIAIYFKQGRWAMIGFGLMGVPYALLAVCLIVYETVTVVTR